MYIKPKLTALVILSVIVLALISTAPAWGGYVDPNPRPAPFLTWPVPGKSYADVTKHPDTPWSAHKFNFGSSCPVYNTVPGTRPGEVGCHQGHAGTDITAAPNTAAVAAVQGTVHDVWMMTTGEKAVRITFSLDGHTWYVVYRHLDPTNVQVSVNQTVYAGITTIGYVSWNRHLHFELLRDSTGDDNRVNPWGRDSPPWSGCLWLDQGICASAGSAPNIEQPLGNECLKPWLRYWHESLQDHFYTASWDELGPGQNGWMYEGFEGYIAIQANCYAPNAQPYYRYYKPDTGDHYYTPNWNELGSGKDGYVYEGVAGYVLLAPNSQYNTQPIYKYYHGALQTHFYTVNWNELGNGNSEWGYEGISAYVFNSNALRSTSSTIILAIGGNLNSQVGNTSYSFPAASFSSPTVVIHTQRFADGVPSFGNSINIGHVFSIEAIDSNTGQPASLSSGKSYTVTVQYSDAELGQAFEPSLHLYYWNGGQWVKEAGSSVNTVANTVTVTSSRFTQWAVLGSQPKNVFLPLIKK